MSKRITVREYRAFCETMYSCPPGTDRETYLEWLLAEELGEVASLFSKAIRDGAVLSTHLGTITVYGPDAVLVHNRHLLEKELGDVMWAAVMMDRYNVPSAGNDFDKYQDQWPSGMTENVQNASMEFREWNQYVWSHQTHTEFEAICAVSRGFGFDPERVALANVAKLKSRKARGVVHGAGGDR